MQEAAANGINGTPAVITGKTFINGAQSLATFTAAIDAQLK
jgi:protein-disulfide isomerase